MKTRQAKSVTVTKMRDKYQVLGRVFNPAWVIIRLSNADYAYDNTFATILPCLGNADRNNSNAPWIGSPCINLMVEPSVTMKISVKIFLELKSTHVSMATLILTATMG